MRRVFKSDKHERHFKKHGYVIVHGLLNKEDILPLTALFTKYHSEYQTAFHASHFSKNTSYKRDAHQLISDIVFKRAASLLDEYVPIFGNFMVKAPDPETGLDIHSDWTYVDEEKCYSIAIWVPLVDTFPGNGCLGIVKGSHNITNKIRGPGIVESSRNFNDLWAARYGTLLPMRAGDSIFYHHGLLHFSPPNKTNKLRPAINLSLVPKEAECLHFCIPEGHTEIEVYHVPNSEFYLNYNHFQRPLTQSLIKKLKPEYTIRYIDTEMKHYRIKRLNRLIRELFRGLKTIDHPI